MPFNVIVVGAGISGLASAISLRRHGNVVTVYEAGPALSEAGAGLQIPPNSFRLLDQLGVGDRLRGSSVKPKASIYKMYSTGDVIKVNPLNPQLEEVFGAPYHFAHRKAYQQILYEVAIELGVQVVFDSSAVSINENTPALKLKSGETIEADLIVGADGIRSPIRQMIHGDSSSPNGSPHCAYRTLIPLASMVSSELTSPLMSEPCQTVWFGPSSHVVGYPIGDFYNMVAVCPGKTSLGKWTIPCDVSELRSNFTAFEPVVQALLHHVDRTAKWLLAYMPPLKQWTSLSGKVTLVGDAAHAMLPYLAQGAAQAIEDAAVLGPCLERASCSAEIPRMMAMYEQLRKPRADRIVAASNENGEIFHMVDETEQKRRNEAMAKGSLYIMGTEVDEVKAEERQNLRMELASGRFHTWLFEFDAIADARERLDQMNPSYSSSRL